MIDSASMYLPEDMNMYDYVNDGENACIYTTFFCIHYQLNTGG